MSGNPQVNGIRPTIWAGVLATVAVVVMVSWLSMERQRSPNAAAREAQDELRKVAALDHESPKPYRPHAVERIPEEEIAHAESWHEGEPLHTWLEVLSVRHFDDPDPEAYDAALEAVRAIGPQAVPLLMKLFEGDEAARGRACAGFLALGGQAETAAPGLFQLIEKYPGYAPDALASIGAPAVPFLQECLNNDKLFAEHVIIPGNTMVGMLNAINLGGIPPSEFYPLLPRILELAKSDNPHSVRYAKSLVDLLVAEMPLEIVLPTEQEP